MTTTTQNPVVFFEIGCANLPETKQFYQQVFGWEPDAANHVNPSTELGIPGHLVSLGHEPHQYVTVYIQVPDIVAAIEKVEANSGKKIVGPIPLPDGKQFAWVQDNGGNILGLVTPGQ